MYSSSYDEVAIAHWLSSFTYPIISIISNFISISYIKQQDKKQKDNIEDMIKRPIRPEASMPLTENISNSKHAHHTHTITYTMPEKNQSYLESKFDFNLPLNVIVLLHYFMFFVQWIPKNWSTISFGTIQKNLCFIYNIILRISS